MNFIGARDFIPIKLSVIYGTEVPCSENNNLA